jgi:hypothetical protein
MKKKYKDMLKKIKEREPDRALLEELKQEIGVLNRDMLLDFEETQELDVQTQINLIYIYANHDGEYTIAKLFRHLITTMANMEVTIGMNAMEVLDSDDPRLMDEAFDKAQNLTNYERRKRKREEEDNDR